VQDFASASELGHVLLVTAKSPAFVPVIKKLLKATETAPPLVRTAPSAELVVPTVCVEKLRLEVTVRDAASPVGFVPGGDSAAQAELAVSTWAIDCGSELGGTNHCRL
jgi:hypothetical protein